MVAATSAGVQPRVQRCQPGAAAPVEGEVGRYRVAPAGVARLEPERRPPRYPAASVGAQVGAVARTVVPVRVTVAFQELLPPAALIMHG